MIAVCSTAGLSALLAGLLAGLLLPPSADRFRSIPYLFSSAGSALFGAAGGLELSNSGNYLVHLHVVGLELGRPAGLLDHLSGLFLLITCPIASMLSLVALGSPHDRSRITPASFNLLILAVVGVILSANAFDFMLSWELVAVGVSLLVLARRKDIRGMRSSWLAAVTGKGSGAMLLLGVLLLSVHSGSLAMADFSSGMSSTVRAIAWILCGGAFAMKMGIVPFQPWMPAAYPQASAPARALMAGVAINVGVYGLWRFLGILGAPPVPVVVIVLILGGITALAGISFAAVERDLARFISWSSVENAGIILTAFGVACAGEIEGSHIVAAAGLVAATLQCIAHAFGKSLLFGSASRIESAGNSASLDALSLPASRVPVARIFFIIGCLSLAGMPPLTGFVSEWFVMEGLAQLFRLHGLAIPLSMSLAGALVALTAGIAGFAFVRSLGISIAGAGGRLQDPESRSDRVPASIAGAVSGLGAGVLAAGLVVLSVVTPLEIRVIASGLSGIIPKSYILASLPSPFVVEPAAVGYSVLSPSWLWLAFGVMIALVLIFTVIMSGGRYFHTRMVEPWQSGAATGQERGSQSSLRVAEPWQSGAATAGDSALEANADHAAGGYTAGSYANIMKGILGIVLRSKKSIQGEQSQTRYIHEVRDPVTTYIYRPSGRLLLRIAHAARHLQSGKLNVYVIYMFLVLIALLAVIRFIH